MFEIYDKAGNVADTIRSDSRGAANSKPLPLDRYTFREISAPANYGVNDTEFTAYLEHEGQIVRFEVTDKSLTTGVSINKTGPKEGMAGQPVNYRFDHIGNTSNVRLDSFYWRDTIPYEVRLQTVVTGTYNFPASYKIAYRVNGGDPRTLADNLSTQRNYTLNASPAALGLASNERDGNYVRVRTGSGRIRAGGSPRAVLHDDFQCHGQHVRQYRGRGRRVQRTMDSGRQPLDNVVLPQTLAVAPNGLLIPGVWLCRRRRNL